MWPFLVAKGRTVPQRVVMAPGFLVEPNLAFLLMRATGDHPEPDPASFRTTVLSRRIIDKRAGEFTKKKESKKKEELIIILVQ